LFSNNVKESSAPIIRFSLIALPNTGEIPKPSRLFTVAPPLLVALRYVVDPGYIVEPVPSLPG